MKSLLIVSHGSRRSASNEEVIKLARAVELKSNNTFDFVHCAFLELAQPSIPQGVIDCIEKGATHISVLPYFLAAGRHVVEDIPNEVKQVEYDPARVEIVIKPHIGAAENMPDTLLNMCT